MTWPSSTEEVWRYSRIDEFDLDRFQPRAAEQRSLDLPTLDAGLAAKGVVVGDLFDVDDIEAADWFGHCSDASPDPFTLLHDTFVVGGAYVRVPAGVVVEEPLFFEHRSGGDGLASFPHTLVVVGEGADVTVVDRFAANGAPHLCDIVIELIVGDAARVRYVSVQEHAPTTWQIGLQRAHVGRDASLRSSAVALGGDYARMRTESLLTGTAAESDLLAVYFGDGDQMLDFRTLQDHAAPHTRSDLLFKGAVEDDARSVYSGLVHLRPEAQRSVAVKPTATWSSPKAPARDRSRTSRSRPTTCAAPTPARSARSTRISATTSRPGASRPTKPSGSSSSASSTTSSSGSLSRHSPDRCAAASNARWVASMAEVRVASVDDVPPGTSRRVDVDGLRLAVVRLPAKEAGDPDDWYVVGDRCSHADYSLSEGDVWVDEREIECPKHGSTFSLLTGEPLSLPATKPIPVYRVRVDGDDVYVDVP